jgi:hypothetical protein
VAIVAWKTREGENRFRPMAWDVATRDWSAVRHSFALKRECSVQKKPAVHCGGCEFRADIFPEKVVVGEFVGRLHTYM